MVIWWVSAPAKTTAPSILAGSGESLLTNSAATTRAKVLFGSNLRSQCPPQSFVSLSKLELHKMPSGGREEQRARVGKRNRTSPIENELSKYIDAETCGKRVGSSA